MIVLIKNELFIEVSSTDKVEALILSQVWLENKKNFMEGTYDKMRLKNLKTLHPFLSDEIISKYEGYYATVELENIFKKGIKKSIRFYNSF